MTCQSYLTPDPGDFGYTSYTGDGEQLQYAVGFPFIGQDAITSGNTSPYIVVRVNGAEQSYTFVNTTTIAFDVAPADGSLVEIVRQSSLQAALVDWQNSSAINRANLDRMNDQLQFLCQEVYMRVKALGCEVNSLLEQGGTGVVEYNFTGNGSQTVFSLSPETGLTDPYTLVFLNGVRQKTDTYSIAGTPSEITFTSAPGNGVAVSIVVLEAQLVAYTLADGSVTSAKIADGSVTYAKLGMNAHGSNNQAFMKRTGVWQASSITASDVSNFDSQVRTSRLDQMAVPTANINLGAQRITNLTSASANDHATNLGQVNTLIAAAVAGIGSSTFKLTAGSATVNSSSYASTTFGFDWDVLLLQVWTPSIEGTGSNSVFNETGEPGGPDYKSRPMYIILGADGSGEQTINYSSADGTVGTNYWNINFQKITNGFQAKWGTSHVGTPVSLRYIAAKFV